MSNSHRALERNTFGQGGVVYPGHCVAIAFLIMQTYPSLETAMLKKGEYPDALTNEDIPGAGGCVHSALDVLKRAFSVGIDEAFAFGDALWVGETSSSYRDRQQAGQKQADDIKQQFRERFQTWRQNEPVAH